jgi:UDP-N-acetylmuramoyl-tripeptide--D-alanyl-D-alanine ligase
VTAAFWTDANVREALGGGRGDRGISYRKISTDTRQIGEGDIFVALKGERFDGHEFIGKAVEAGATAAVVSDAEVEAPEGVILYRTGDTLVALQQLAAFRRDRIRARFVGVVGSNGKTTTKELIRSVLQTTYTTFATQGNLNNQIGVPLTLLEVPDEVEAVVVEMGTDRPGEIRALTRIVRPDVAVVTSIGEEHLELLGDLHGVLQEEISVVEGLPGQGMLFVAEEPATLPEAARQKLGEARVRVAGLGEEADLRPDDGLDGVEVREDGSTRWRWNGMDVQLPIPGRVHVRNALLALGVGIELGVSPDNAVRGIAEVTLPGLRGEWHRFGEMRVLADCYNANPPSLMAAVDLLATLPSHGRTVAVLGTMRELGPTSEKLHVETAGFVADRVGSGVDLVVATGAFTDAFASRADELGERLILARDPVEAYQQARGHLKGGETILLKASRGDQLERWLPLLEDDFGNDSSPAGAAVHSSEG